MSRAKAAGVKQGKAWGTTECLLSNPFVSIHRLVIEQTRTCSVHRHRLKANFFYIISGRLRVWVEKADYNLTDMTELREGDCMEVVPGEYHWFEAMTLC